MLVKDGTNTLSALEDKQSQSEDPFFFSFARFARERRETRWPVHWPARNGRGEAYLAKPLAEFYD